MINDCTVIRWRILTCYKAWKNVFLTATDQGSTYPTRWFNILWSVCQHHVRLHSDSVSSLSGSPHFSSCFHVTLFVLVGFVRTKVWSRHNISHRPDIYLSGCVARRQAVCENICPEACERRRGREDVSLRTALSEEIRQRWFLLSGEKNSERCSRFSRNCKKTTGQKPQGEREEGQSGSVTVHFKNSSVVNVCRFMTEREFSLRMCWRDKRFLLKVTEVIWCFYHQND